MTKLLLATLAIMTIFYLFVIKPTAKKNRKEPTFSSSNASVEDKKRPGFVVEHRKMHNLCTDNEQKFLGALKQVLPDSYMVHCQTSLMAIVQPIDYKDNSKTWAKRMDFVVTDGLANIVAVIELDDSSHQRPDRQKRDQYVNSVLAGHHPLIRFQTLAEYDPAQIATVLYSNIELLETANERMTL